LNESRALQAVNKEVVGIHALLTRSLFGGGIPAVIDVFILGKTASNSKEELLKRSRLENAFADQ
jgi:hypothetical protein